MAGEEEEVLVAYDRHALDAFDLLGPGLEGWGEAGSDVPLGLLLVERLELVLSLVPEYQAGEAALRVGIREYDAVSFRRQHPTEVECRRSLADAALVVEEGDSLDPFRIRFGRRGFRVPGHNSLIHSCSRHVGGDAPGPHSLFYPVHLSTVHQRFLNRFQSHPDERKSAMPSQWIDGEAFARQREWPGV